MHKLIVKQLKRIPFIYKFARFLFLFFKALLSVRLNIDKLLEFFIFLKGGQPLSSGNQKLYSNIFPNLIEKFSPNVVIFDVGANDGWFARVVYRYAPRETEIVSFEPLTSMHIHLEKIAKLMPNYTFEKVALGEDNVELSITEYEEPGLSSFKELSEQYRYDEKEYNTNAINKYKVDVISLDNYLQKHQKYQNIILKIDTQGFEMEVLKGARLAFEKGKINVVIIEVMTLEKYKKSKLYIELFDYLHFFGFKLFDIHAASYEKNGALSEFDCVFIKA